MSNQELLLLTTRFFKVFCLLFDDEPDELESLENGVMTICRTVPVLAGEILRLLVQIHTFCACFEH